MKTPTRTRRSILLDPIEPADFNRMSILFACEDCAHFALSEKRCTLGFNAQNHLKEVQLERFQASGNMAFCRFLEID